MKVKKDWWKDFFNHIYLITDSRSVCDNTLTRRETNLLEEVLVLDKNGTVLGETGYKDISPQAYIDELITFEK